MDKISNIMSGTKLNNIKKEVYKGKKTKFIISSFRPTLDPDFRH